MRHIIELLITHRNAENEMGYRTHVITLANNAATKRVVEAIQDGVTPWNSVVEQEDVLEYDDALDG